MEKILGAWNLKTVTYHQAGEVYQYDDIKGILLYTFDGYFSVSLKMNPTPKTPYHPNLILNYYSAGKFSPDGDLLNEENIIHGFDKRMGEKRQVKIQLEPNSLKQFFEFSESCLIMTWVR